jgi:hypothetical protein
MFVKVWKMKYLIHGGNIYGTLREISIVKLSQYYTVTTAKEAPDVQKVK